MTEPISSSRFGAGLGVGLAAKLGWGDGLLAAAVEGGGDGRGVDAAAGELVQAASSSASVATARLMNL
jgi:hypothetical protein